MSTARLAACLAISLCLLSSSSPALAGDWGGRRYALLVGNNVGQPDEKLLRFAERDAVRLTSILQRHGAVPSENTVLMLGATAPAIRRAMLELNARIRSETNRARERSVLVVYYSGHAGADGLHPGEGVLSYDELRAMLRGSPATARLLLLDGCRSGEMTAVKGARSVPEFAVQVDQQMGVEGLVMISSSAAGEDSHESDRLGASFFSHHLSNALLGAADDNRDGRITLREAYGYAYRNTLRASGRTVSLQHPTFAFELKGRGDMVLTDLSSGAQSGALLRLPTVGLYLVFENDADGPLVAEVQVRKKDAHLAVQPGAYFVQYRQRDHYLEYSIEVEPGELKRLDPEQARRVEYARLVRKGDAEKFASHGLFASAAGRGALIDGRAYAVGFGLTYSLALPWLSLSLRARYLRHPQQQLTEVLRVDQEEVALGAAVQYFGDWRRLSAGGGLVLDAVLHRQAFFGRARAGDRLHFGIAFGALLTVELALVGPLSLRLEGGPKTYILNRATTEAGVQTGTVTRTPVTFFLNLGLGWML